MRRAWVKISIITDWWVEGRQRCSERESQTWPLAESRESATLWEVAGRLSAGEWGRREGEREVEGWNNSVGALQIHTNPTADNYWPAGSQWEEVTRIRNLLEQFSIAAPCGPYWMGSEKEESGRERGAVCAKKQGQLHYKRICNFSFLKIQYYKHLCRLFSSFFFISHQSIQAKE